jgi:hypothetical protein
MKSALITVVALVVVASYSAFARPDDNKGPITGVLIDQACGAKQMTKDDPQAAAAKHPKACCVKEACASSGYAVISGKTMYKLDDKGAQLAKDYLAKEDSKTMVTVEGNVKDDTIEVTAINPAEKKS